MIAATNFDTEVAVVPNAAGHHLVVDRIDAERVGAHTWRVDSGDRTFKFYTSIGGRKVYLSRFILGAKPGELVDHINGDRLDNRRANLRLASHLENSRNRRKSDLATTSRFKGVCKNTRGRRLWKSAIRANGKVISIGKFDCEEAAARAYDEAARRFHGAFGRFNFPLPGEQPALSPTGGC